MTCHFDKKTLMHADIIKYKNNKKTTVLLKPYFKKIRDNAELSFNRDLPV
jgi:hypothetical protein